MDLLFFVGEYAMCPTISIENKKTLVKLPEFFVLFIVIVDRARIGWLVNCDFDG